MTMQDRILSESAFDIVNAIQIGMTLTFILMCVHLITVWRVAFSNAVSAGLKRGLVTWTGEQWLITGIVIGFAGAAVDNLYWMFAWLLIAAESPYSDTALRFGPTANIFARQLAGGLAVYCHLRAAILMTSEKTALNRLIIGYLILGGLTCILALLVSFA